MIKEKNGKPVAIVLGGTNAHIALIDNLKNRGYYTILVDYYPNPPAKEFADLHLQESTLDKNRVLELAKEYSVDLVISTCVDQANVTACYVAENLGLPAPYSYETALRVTNKEKMKSIMKTEGIPTSPYSVLNKLHKSLIPDLHFPLIVKPTDSNGSKGVRKVNNYTELAKAFVKAKEVSRTNQVIIEEFINGIELSIYCIIKNTESHIILMNQRLSVIQDKEAIVQCYAAIYPIKVNNYILEKVKNISNRIARIFELDNTPLFLQIIVKDNEVYVIEFAPRVGGGLSYKNIFLNTGFDIINATVNSYLHIPIELNYHEPVCYYSTNNIYAIPCVIDRVEGYDKLLQNTIISSFYIHKKKGVIVSSDMSSGNRVASFIIKADSLQELFLKTKIAMKQLEIVDSEGNKVMKRDYYINENLNLVMVKLGQEIV